MELGDEEFTCNIVAFRDREICVLPQLGGPVSALRLRIKQSERRKTVALSKLSVEDLKSTLEKAQVTFTPHRLRVLQTIWDSPFPLSHRDIAQQLKETNPIDRVTLYRTLELLVGSRLIERITSIDRSFRYARADKAPHDHPHFYCSGCGVLECLDADLFNLNLESIQERLPVTVRRVHVRIDGLCRKCRERKS